MKITDWIHLQGFGGRQNLMRESGLSYSSIHKVVNEGHTFNDLLLAKAVSEATGGDVPVELLWTPAVEHGVTVPRPGRKKSRKR